MNSFQALTKKLSVDHKKKIRMVHGKQKQRNKRMAKTT